MNTYPKEEPDMIRTLTLAVPLASTPPPAAVVDPLVELQAALVAAGSLW